MARVVTALAAATAILALAGAAHAAPANTPRTTTTNALTRLMNDTAALRATDASARTRRGLAGLASGAQTAAFYNGGVRVVDLSGLPGYSVGETSISGEGMKEIGYYRMPDADTWSAKTPQIDRKTGDFYLFGNDIKRGLDIYHFSGEGGKPKSRGKWMNAEEARITLADRPAPGTKGTTYICLLDD